jgi:hypothetical protein
MFRNDEDPREAPEVSGVARPPVPPRRLITRRALVLALLAAILLGVLLGWLTHAVGSARTVSTGADAGNEQLAHERRPILA